MNKYQDTVQYMHFRAYDKDGTIRPNEGSTFAYVEIPATGTDAARVRWGKACCSRADNFNRKIGKTIALHRLGTDERAKEFVGTVKEFQANVAARQSENYGLARKYSKKSK